MTTRVSCIHYPHSYTSLIENVTSMPSQITSFVPSLPLIFFPYFGRLFSSVFSLSTGELFGSHAYAIYARNNNLSPSRYPEITHLCSNGCSSPSSPYQGFGRTRRLGYRNWNWQIGYISYLWCLSQFGNCTRIISSPFSPQLPWPTFQSSLPVFTSTLRNIVSTGQTTFTPKWQLRPLHVYSNLMINPFQEEMQCLPMQLGSGITMRKMRSKLPKIPNWKGWSTKFLTGNLPMLTAIGYFSFIYLAFTGLCLNGRVCIQETPKRIFPIVALCIMFGIWVFCGQNLDGAPRTAWRCCFWRCNCGSCSERSYRIPLITSSLSWAQWNPLQVARFSLQSTLIRIWCGFGAGCCGLSFPPHRE